MASRISFPKEQDVVLFSASFDGMKDVSWSTYASKGVPENKGLYFNFKNEFSIAKELLMNQSMGLKEPIDVLHIDGGPLYFINNDMGKSRIYSSSLLVEAVDVYSRLRTKSYKALDKIDNYEARNYLFELSSKLENEIDNLNPDFDKTEKKFNEVFSIFLRAVLDEDI